MNWVDIVIIVTLDYLLLGLFRVAEDFSQPLVNQPMYARRRKALSVFLVILTWPPLVWWDLRADLGLGKADRFTVITRLIHIVGLFLWTYVAYDITGDFVASRIVRILVTIPLLFVFLIIINKILKRRKNS